MESKYKQLLTSFPGFMQSGSFFPDWGYQCLGYNQQSEDAHWAPFIKTAINYVRDTYPQPWTDPHIQGLIVFIFAIMSHDVADVKWHSLNGLENYFIQAMSQLDFDGDYQKAHTVADTGAEFTLQHAARVGYLNETWQVPLQDLVNIYELYYSNDNIYQQQQQQHLTNPFRPMIPLKDHLRYCMVAAFAGVKLDLKFGQWMFDYYGAKRLQDLAASVSYCYKDMIHAFESGVPDILCDDYFDNGLHSKNNSVRFEYHTKVQRPTFRHRWIDDDDIEQLQRKYGIIDDWDTKNGILTLTLNQSTFNEQYHHLLQQQNDGSHQHYNDKFQQVIINTSSATVDLSVQHLLEEPFHNHCRPLEQVSSRKEDSISALSIPSSLASFGHATVIGDFDGDGHIDLAISAPYYSIDNNDGGVISSSLTMAGAVFILDGQKQPMIRQQQMDDARNESKQVLLGKDSDGRFGWALAVIDMNRDGIDDLAVASPFANGLQGKVDIFFGSLDHGLASEPNRTLLSAATTEGWGYILAGFDINQDGYRDLLVGCPYCTTMNIPQAGSVEMFLSKSIYGNNDDRRQEIIPDQIFQSNTPMSYEHFGWSMTFFSSLTNYGTLLVGAPSAKINNVPQVGKVYGFIVLNDISSKLQWMMPGKRKFEQFGTVLQGWKNDMLVISSPTEDTYSGVRKYWQGGSVRLYDWRVLDRGQKSLATEYGLVKKIKGQQVSGHFGASVVFFQDKDDNVGLWIGEPMGSKEKGRLYRWIVNKERLDCLENHATMARFGSRVINVGTDVICITSQHDSHSARFSGAIHLYQTLV
ncbi:uncharacterized protein BX664DRAFT_313143 [Halteromyces radiatus]|uniref:uncharacterized protein n=1 Tax=Halteromyces radiatus TaxID=101107 RepID=UPI00221F14C0|nr:uncharacterized protein BX664DRAFT_313143 [Halteromyces radiatus]KAI8093053.1 hypothetical protein BX664DRAFT_313143 [Halteromyces radiatus]